MSPILPPKKDVALALLERASVFVHLDPRSDAVLVPAWLKKQAQLVLQVGLNMAVKIPDLDVGEDSVSCTLSFSRRPCFCQVPWSAVYALVGEDGRGMVWPEDIPPEVAAQTQPPQAPRRPSLRAIGGFAAEDEGEHNALAPPFSSEASEQPLASQSPASQPPVFGAAASQPPISQSFASQPREPKGQPQRRGSKRPSLVPRRNEEPLESAAAVAAADSSRELHRSPSERPYLRLIK